MITQEQIDRVRSCMFLKKHVTDKHIRKAIRKGKIVLSELKEMKPMTIGKSYMLDMLVKPDYIKG